MMLVFFKYALHIKPLNALCLTHMGIYCTGMTAVGSTGTSDILLQYAFLPFDTGPLQKAGEFHSEKHRQSLLSGLML